MTIWLAHLILALAASGLGYSLLRRPLSEDDGNWFYHAWFQDRGVRLYREVLTTYGYFGIFGLAALLFRVFRGKTPQFFTVFKAIWYFCNALSLYWLTLVWTSHPGMALTAALLLILVMAIANTLFFLTYAEHFLILPFGLALIALHLGLAGSGHGLFLAAGLFAGWAVQIKPTALLFAAALLPACRGSASPGIDGALYLAALLGVNLLPCLLLRRDGAAKRAYLVNTFGGACGLLAILLERVSVPLSHRLIPAALRSGQGFAYLRGHHRLTGKAQQEALRRFMGPALRDLRLVVLLALLQGIGLFPGRFDALTLAMLALALLCIAMQQLQKNYYTPHFNPLWMPLCVLAAKTLWEAGASALAGGPAGWIVLLLAAGEVPRLAGVLFASLRPQARQSAGFLGPVLGALFSLGKSIGAYLQAHSRPDEKLLVWGDHPSIYLYADRQCFNPDYLFLYTHARRIEDDKELARFIDCFRQAPPEWVLFYRYQHADGWTMARLEEAAGIPYRPVTQFQVNDGGGKVIEAGGVPLCFPLYRRDDERYREILRERAAFALVSSDPEAYRAGLQRILALDPEDPEGRIRWAALGEGGQSREGLRAYLENLSREADPEKAALVSLLLGDLHRQAGRLEEAARRYAEAGRTQDADFRIFSGLSDIAYARGDRKGALQFLEKAYRLNPFSAELSNNLGVFYLLANEREKARRFFRKALTLIPGYPDALYNLEQLCPESCAGHDRA
jgi:tetratricopeptide (TPR) repeat protein